MSLTQGQSFEDMHVIARLGDDVQGEFYLVEHPTRGQQILKLAALPATDTANFLAYLNGELSSATQAFAHPGIVAVTDFGTTNTGTTDDSFWFTVNPLEGSDLRDTRLNDADAARVAADLADALDFTHSRGLTHRDVRPGNILLTRNPRTGHITHVALLNLGLSALAEHPDLPTTIGNPAPEVTHGQPATAHSDQYALAATLYELLTGHTAEHATPLSAYRPDLTELDGVFARALATDPTHRFPTCRDFAAHLTHTLATTPDYRATTPDQRAPSAFPNSDENHWDANPFTPTKRNRKPLLIGAIVAVILLLAASITTYALTRNDDTPPPVAGQAAEPEKLTVTDVSVERDKTCAVAGGDVYCWGSNINLGVGVEDTRTVSTPHKVERIANATAVSITTSPACAIGDGSLYCWGNKSWNTSSTDDAVLVEGLTDVVDIATYIGAICARTEDGNLYCWGNNEKGQAAVADTETVTSPTLVEGLTDVTDVAMDSDTTCAIAGGDVYCWGANENEILGNDDPEFTTHEPTKIDNISNATALGVQRGIGERACVATDTAVECWGPDPYGQGDPKPAMLTGVTAFTNTCVLADGAAYCWGLNENGRVGNGTTEYVTNPVRVPGLGTVTALSSSAESTCAISDDELYCWGGNESGQLGNGTTNASPRPVKVDFPIKEG